MASSFSAGTPPPGVESNFDNPLSLRPVIIATTTLCIFLPTTFVSARLFVKWKIATWSIEDYLLIVAGLLNIEYNAVFLAQVKEGLGRHIWDVPIQNGARIAQLSWALIMSYFVAICIAKLALLFQLIRIFTPTKTGRVYTVTMVLVLVNSMLYFATLLSVIFECIPQEKIWNPEVKGARCINIQDALIITSAFNAASDAMILVLPMWATWQLKLRMKHKVGIIAVFATGLLAFIASIGRLVYTVKISHTQDSTYVIAQTGLWTLAEIATINLCTCFPMMPRLMQMLRSGHARGNSYLPNSAPYRDISKRPSGHQAFGDSSSYLKKPDTSYDTSVWTEEEIELRGMVPSRSNAVAGLGSPDKGPGLHIQKTVSIRQSDNAC